MTFLNNLVPIFCACENCWCASSAYFLWCIYAHVPFSLSALLTCCNYRIELPMHLFAEIVRLEHFNRAQNIFARKVFILYLAMQHAVHQYVYVTRTYMNCVFTYSRKKRAYLKRGKAHSAMVSLMNDSNNNCISMHKLVYDKKKMNLW